MVRVSSRDDDSTTREKVSVLEDAREMRRRGEEEGGGGVWFFGVRAERYATQRSHRVIKSETSEKNLSDF